MKVRNRFKVAIQWDDYGYGDSAAPLWADLLRKAGHEVLQVDVRHADILDQLKGCDGFMWRFAQYPDLLQIARRLLPVVERELGIAVYPDQGTSWHYDDKIAQSLIFQALGIPTPRTWVWFDRDLALDWAKTVTYPLVMKLAGGAGSDNVLLLNSYSETEENVNVLFDGGVKSFSPSRHFGMRLRWKNFKKMMVRDITDNYRYLRFGVKPSPKAEPAPVSDYWGVHKNYAYFQEFLSGNEFDIRVTVIGERAFAFRRFNRQDDFRASGSGKIDFDPTNIPQEFVRLAFDVASKVGMQSCAIDGMWRGDEPVVGEISYTFASWAIHDCPGHWDNTMNWVPGQIRAEEAQIDDFIQRLQARTIIPASCRKDIATNV